MRFKNRSEMVLYLWDYFYISNAPAPCDEAPWAMIERATCRIHESEIKLHPRTPPDERLRSARRIRNAARLVMRQIERLSVRPEQWVEDCLVELEIEMSETIRALTETARRVVIH